MSCYLLSDDKIWTSAFPFIVCGSNSTDTGQYCCALGDVCLEDSICHFNHSDSQSVSGYYMGGCTDTTFAGLCSKQCGDHPTQDIYYNETTDLWQCCYGDGSLDCATPSTETFEGPSLAQLEALLSASATSSYYSTTSLVSVSSSPLASIAFSSSFSSLAVFATTTNIATDSITSKPTSTICQSNGTCSSSQGLSSGIKAAIGVPIAICFLLLTCLIFIMYRSWRKRQYFESPAIPVKVSPKVETKSFLPELGVERQRESDSTALAELSAHNNRGG